MDSVLKEKSVNTSIVVFIVFFFKSVKIDKKAMNKPLSPSTAKSATFKPITVPFVNETFKVCFKLVRVACVVRTFAFVVTFMLM